MSLILFVFILSSDDYDEKESVGVCMFICLHDFYSAGDGCAGGRQTSHGEAVYHCSGLILVVEI